MIFLTGVPGFLGTRLLRSLAAEYPDRSLGLLVQPKFERTTRQVLRNHALADRTTVLPGDITEPDLGLGDRYDDIADRITMACHLAAVYDLSIPRDVGWRINVDGTRHVLDLLAQCPNLERFGYVSTAYVSGQRTGTLYENELIHNTGFKNFYEETKYHAEVLVQDRMDEIPTMIFRPSIVVGDSETGETDKFDGPYFVLHALQQLPRYTLMTRIGSGTEPVNLIPVDFAIAAMSHLLGEDDAIDTVFHLTDPQPLTTQAILELFSDLLDKNVAYVPVPSSVARTLMGTGIGRYLGIAPELIDYFDHPSRYDNSNTQSALAGTGISCPHLPDYAPKMVEYMHRHADVRSEAMY
ncbi:3-beta hydroxysteroid dehydrogenase [Salinibacter sp. 10B]|uniref:SDR family oxidoreductase n=1 Tax=Salinibacter sp. 10B TaxID=1923971 RepID=UPI000D2611C8|nr:SDR family oxidoreductase [Salinibacter sp. 10B]PQJ36354.1 3-beta hydroxysteroid dehydrogenase [Salinibacter sp. 10B]